MTSDSAPTHSVMYAETISAHSSRSIASAGRATSAHSHSGPDTQCRVPGRRPRQLVP